MTGAPPVATPRLSLVPLAATLYWSTDLGLGELLIHHGEIFRLKLAEKLQGVPNKDLLWFFWRRHCTGQWMADYIMEKLFKSNWQKDTGYLRNNYFGSFFPELDHHISGTISNSVEFSWSKSMG